MKVNDIYVRVTDAKGKQTVRHHRVWDGARFIKELCSKALRRKTRQTPSRWSKSPRNSIGRRKTSE